MKGIATWAKPFQKRYTPEIEEYIFTSCKEGNCERIYVSLVESVVGSHMAVEEGHVKIRQDTLFINIYLILKIGNFHTLLQSILLSIKRIIHPPYRIEETKVIKVGRKTYTVYGDLRFILW